MLVAGDAGGVAGISVLAAIRHPQSRFEHFLWNLSGLADSFALWLAGRLRTACTF